MSQKNLQANYSSFDDNKNSDDDVWIIEIDNQNSVSNSVKNLNDSLVNKNDDKMINHENKNKNLGI